MIKNFCTGENGDKEITLYAQWELEQYKLSYVLNGGQNNVDNPLDGYNIESETIELKNPTRNGYIFGGWYNNKNFSGSRITSIPSGSTGNKTLYAKWIYYSNFVQRVDVPLSLIHI